MVALFVHSQKPGLSSQSSVPGGTDAASLLSKAQHAIDLGALDEAVHLLHQYLTLEPRHRLARQALIDVLMRKLQWDEAWHETEILLKQYPKNARVFSLAGAVAFRRGDFEKATEMAREAIRLDDTRIDAFRLLAFSRYMLKDAEGFKAALQALLDRDPNNAEAYYHLGRYYYEADLFGDGVTAFGKAVALDPELYKAHFFLAWCYQARGDTERSKQHFRRSIEIIERKKVNYGWPYADLGEELIAEGRYEEGLGWLYRGVRNDPGLPYTQCKYAGALLKNEASTEIEIHLKEALKLEPTYAEAYYLLARYYQKVGDREAAKEAFSKFQQYRKNAPPSPFGVRH